jgi:hypothetical protein
MQTWIRCFGAGTISGSIQASEPGISNLLWIPSTAPSLCSRGRRTNMAPRGRSMLFGAKFLRFQRSSSKIANMLRIGTDAKLRFWRLASSYGNFQPPTAKSMFRANRVKEPQPGSWALRVCHLRVIRAERRSPIRRRLSCANSFRDRYSPTAQRSGQRGHHSPREFAAPVATNGREATEPATILACSTAPAARSPRLSLAVIRERRMNGGATILNGCFSSLGGNPTIGL